MIPTGLAPARPMVPDRGEETSTSSSAASHDGHHGIYPPKQTLFKTVDGGTTWTPIGANLPGGTNFSSAVTFSDTQTFLVGTGGWGGGTSALFRSADGGTTWAQVSTTSPTGYPLYASDGTIYWGTDGGILKSKDKGATWTKTGTSAPGGLAAAHPTELPDNRLITVGKDGTVKLSADGGATWKTISAPWPPFLPTDGAAPTAMSGVTYSAQRKLLVAWYWNCWGNLPNDAIWKTAWDYQAN